MLVAVVLPLLKTSLLGWRVEMGPPYSAGKYEYFDIDNVLTIHECETVTQDGYIYYLRDKKREEKILSFFLLVESKN